METESLVTQTSRALAGQPLRVRVLVSEKLEMGQAFADFIHQAMRRAAGVGEPPCPATGNRVERFQQHLPIPTMACRRAADQNEPA